MNLVKRMEVDGVKTHGGNYHTDYPMSNYIKNCFEERGEGSCLSNIVYLLVHHILYTKQGVFVSFCCSIEVFHL